jgi:hypothetical protein
MKVLLPSMPDSFEQTPNVSIRMPNGALPSLAGNVDPHHRIAIVDLILIRGNPRRPHEENSAGSGGSLRHDVPASDRKKIVPIADRYYGLRDFITLVSPLRAD